jgi:MFS family permease
MTRDNTPSRTRVGAGCLDGVSTSAISVSRAAAAGRPPAPAWSLAAALLGFFVVTLDAVIVNVALPDIRRELAGGMSGLQWVADGYTLMFAALLLSAGALADRAGARRAFGAGLAGLALLARAAASPHQQAPFDWAGQAAAVAGMGGLTTGRSRSARPASPRRGCWQLSRSP